MTIVENVGYIYLLQEREFVKTQEQIYKIGKTMQKNLKRFNAYPKGTILLFYSMCTDHHTMERLIIKTFSDNFIRRQDIGAEYFEGDLNSMLLLMNELV